jgi:hypothetical protein
MALSELKLITPYGRLSLKLNELKLSSTQLPAGLAPGCVLGCIPRFKTEISTMWKEKDFAQVTPLRRTRDKLLEGCPVLSAVIRPNIGIIFWV